MKKFRRISALMLALVLICALAISAFAVTESVTCGSVDYDVTLNGSINDVTASVNVTTSGAPFYSGSIELHYVYCDETMVRPSNYTYASTTRNFTKFNISDKGSCTVECSSGNVMIEASADYQMVEQTTSATTTTTNTTLSLGLY